jgi:hypothetical protein
MALIGPGGLGGSPRRVAIMVSVRVPRVPFEVAVVLLLLAVCAAYTVTFSRLVHVSLMEQVFHPDLAPARYIGHSHFHSPFEWALLLSPALLGLLGSAWSVGYLRKRFSTRRRGR